MTKKILLYNWVQFDDAANRGGGVSVFLRNIIPLFYENDCEVTFLSSGDQYSLVSKNIFYEETQNIYKHFGVKSFRIVNSPVVAPAHHSFSLIKECHSNKEISDQFSQFVNEQNHFDETHFHSIEGISTLVIERLKKSHPDMKIIVWFHNFHWICPQIELFKDNSAICTDFHNGIDCVGCLSFIQNPGYIKKAQKVKRLSDKLKLKNTRFETLLFNLFRWGSEFFNTIRTITTFKSVENERSWKDKLRSQDAIMNKFRNDSHDYKDWREININRLNKYTDHIYTVSDQVKKVIGKYGISGPNVETAPLGLSIYKPTSEIIKYANKDWNGKLKIAFFGYPIPSKGLNFLMESIDLLSSEDCNKLSIFIVSRAQDALKRKIIRLQNKVDIQFLDGYKPHEMEELTKSVDIGVVPSLCLETFNLVSYELVSYGIPVLVSDTVGFKTFVKNKDFVFKSSDKHNLAYKIQSLINREILLEQFWDNMEDLPSLKTHYNQIHSANQN